MARPIDRLGRVVLPAQLRRRLDLAPGDMLEITCEQGRIILERVRETCALCGGASHLRAFNGRHVCATCVDTLTGGDVG